MLLWYADLTAVEQCRELRTSCESSADTTSCGTQVKDCLRPVLEQAFAAMCEERLAECAAESDGSGGCKTIQAHCDGSHGPGVGHEGNDDDGGVDEASHIDESAEPQH